MPEDDKGNQPDAPYFAPNVEDEVREDLPEPSKETVDTVDEKTESTPISQFESIEVCPHVFLSE